MDHPYVFLYAGDAFYLASIATILFKIHLENSVQGFSGRTQGVLVAVESTRFIEIVFSHPSAFYTFYNIFKKIIFLSTTIYIVFKIRRLSKGSCGCHQDSFWVEALILPSIIVTALYHKGDGPDEVLWSFSTYLEVGAMVPQLYMTHVRGKVDSYVPPYISIMASRCACHALYYTVEYCDSASELYHEQIQLVWVVCKYLELAVYVWYFFIPTEPVLPAITCEERRRRPTLFLRQESMLAHTLLQKNNSAADLKVFVVGTPPVTPTSAPSTPTYTRRDPERF